MDDLKQKYLGLIANAADESAIEDLRVQALGKKGEISLAMRELGKMTPEERQTAGPALNALVAPRDLPDLVPADLTAGGGDISR